MCGRFANTESGDAIKATFRVTMPAATGGGAGGGNRMPRYNISPGVDIETVINEGGNRMLAPMHWGFILGQLQKPVINARGETIFEKPSFARPARETRCLVVATGWYEWKAPRQPWFIRRRDAAPMAMAGIYRRTETGLATVVVTRAAAGDLGTIHHRAPLTLDETGMAQWLDPAAGEDALKSMITPTDGDGLEWYPVSAEVGQVRHDHEGLLIRDDSHGKSPAAQLDLF